MLNEIEVRRVQRADEPCYQALMQAHHYLGALPKIGEARTLLCEPHLPPLDVRGEPKLVLTAAYHMFKNDVEYRNQTNAYGLLFRGSGCGQPFRPQTIMVASVIVDQQDRQLSRSISDRRRLRCSLSRSGSCME